MNSPFISIIVPIYDVEDFLSVCIESVLNQTYKDFELVLVIDGSPDDSLKICKKYAAKDNRIKVINKKNGGLSDARNRGLKKSSGEYIFFLDGDDYMAENALYNIAKTINKNINLDMLTCTYNTHSPEGAIVKIPLPFSSIKQEINRKKFLDYFVKSPSNLWGVTRNIFSRKVIKKNNLEFTYNLIGAEDCDFFMKFVENANSFGFLNESIFYYRIDRVGSISYKMSKSAILGQLQVFYENYSYFKSKKNFNVAVFFANKFSNAVTLIDNVETTEDIEELVNYVELRKEIFDDTKGIKYQVAKSIWKFLGYYKGSIYLNSLSKVLKE